MANSKTSLKDKQVLAHDLYMRTDKTQKEIAQLVGVGNDTISDWARKGKWKELKAANSITRAQVINNTLLMIKDLQDEIRLREKKYPTYKEQMVLSMQADDIRKLDKSLSLPDYISFTEELLKHLSATNADLAKQVADHVMDFVQEKAKQLKA